MTKTTSVARAATGIAALTLIMTFSATLAGADRPGVAARDLPAQHDGALPAGEGAGPQFDVFGGIVSTHIIVRTIPGVEPIQLADGRWSFAPAGQQLELAANVPTEALADLLQAEGITTIAPGLTVPPQNEALAQQLGLDRYFILEVPQGTDTPALKAMLLNAAPAIAVFEVVELDSIGGVATPPNDPLFSNQWPLHNTGQAACGVMGLPGADISMLEAWTISTGADDLVIAVLDSGANPHVDLSDRLLPGHNVFTGGGVSSDLCGSHGTHVSGTIAANPDNGLHVAGITWQSMIMPVIVVNGCSGNTLNVTNGLIWATDAGADVINMSLQYNSGETFFHNAIKYAYESGIVLVAAAGNNNFSGGVAFPAKFAETIAVAGTTNLDTKWGSTCGSGSNCGPELSVAAPGACVWSLVDTNGAGPSNGTSMAAPHVSGTAALMLALDPSLSPAEVRDILEQTATDLGSPGHNTLFGHGRINAYAALLEVQGRMSIPGDLNGDGSVGVADLLILLGAWGDCADCGDCIADLTGDCNVGVPDMLILLGNWG